MLKSLQVPAQPTERQQALTKLKALEGIHVTRKDVHEGQSVYVIDVFFRKGSAAGGQQPQQTLLPLSPASIPRSQLALHELTSGANGQQLDNHSHGNREPDVSTKKSFLELFELQEALYRASFGCRCAKRCRLCQQFCDYILGSDRTPPAVLRALMTKNAKKKLMEKTINAFVGIVVRAQVLTVTDGSQCESSERIPIMLKTFLEL